MDNIQWLTFVVSIFLFIITSIKMKMYNKHARWEKGFPILLASAHLIIFYFFVMLKHFDIYTLTSHFSDWSPVVKFQLIMTILVKEFFSWRKDNLWKNKKGDNAWTQH